MPCYALLFSYPKIYRVWLLWWGYRSSCATNYRFSAQKILTVIRGSKSFDTNIMEPPPRHLICIIFWSATGSNGPKMPIFGKKANFGPNLAVYGPKILIFIGVSKNVGTSITEKPSRQLVRAGITEKRPFLRSAKKWFFGQNFILSQKNTRNFLRSWYLFWKRVLFALKNFFRPEHG